MSIETILPWVLAECGLDVTAPDISAGDYQMKQIAALMNAAGVDINTRGEWQAATKSHTAPAGASVALPADFQEMTGSGAVVLNKSGYNPVRPVVDATLWQFLSEQPSTQAYYHIDAGHVNFSPDVDASGATIRYISKNWLEGDKAAITDNIDQTIFPDALLARATIWRWRRQKGLPYEDLMAEFEADLEAAIQADRGFA